MEPKDAVVETEEAVAEETVSDETVSEDAASDEAPAAETPKESASEEEAASEADPESGAVPDGPVFEASDRRASIRADHSGVRLRLDDQEAEFRWDEIGAVETESPRFGRRFTITVHTPERRWYPIEIEANARARFKEWEEQLDAVLDAYFEDGEPETEPEPETAAEVEAEAEVETAVEAEVEVEAEVTAEAGSRVEDDKAKAKGEKP